MRKLILSAIIISLLLVFMALAITSPPQVFYPMVKVDVPDPSGNLTINFLFEGNTTLQSCETINGKVARELFSKCPQCRVTLSQCSNTLDGEQQKWLTNEPLPTPTGRMANGDIVFSAANPDSALAACQSSERLSARGHAHIVCFKANSPRIEVAETVPIDLHFVAVICAAFVAAWFCGWLLVKYDNMHAHLSHDHITDSPQKLHAQPTPRIGGLILVTGLLSAGAVMLFTEVFPLRREFMILLLAGSPAFLGGLVEDLTKKVAVIDRLLLTMLSGAIAAWMLGAVLHRLDAPGGDLAIRWMPFAVIFTCFAVSGIANAVNIIDGFNGLAAGFALIVVTPLAFVAYLVGDSLVFTAAIALAGALSGFLVWNWPCGKIFLGDGGAYLLGVLLAELCVLLLVRNSQVTPWFPLLLFVHPVFETLFSMYRRIHQSGHSLGQPDALHFHTLIYKHVVPHESHFGDPFSKLRRNNRVAKYIWIPAIVGAVFGVLFWKSIPMLILGIVLYCITYIVAYQRLLKN